MDDPNRARDNSVENFVPVTHDQDQTDTGSLNHRPPEQRRFGDAGNALTNSGCNSFSDDRFAGIRVVISMW
jgi:hypothetical protein